MQQRTGLHKVTLCLNKCQKVISVLCCLAGQGVRASRSSLQNIYWAVMRSVFDNACLAFVSAAESHLEKLNALETETLRICSGSFNKISGNSNAGTNGRDAFKNQKSLVNAAILGQYPGVLWYTNPAKSVKTLLKTQWDKFYQFWTDWWSKAEKIRLCHSTASHFQSLSFLAGHSRCQVSNPKYIRNGGTSQNNCQ